MRPVLANMGLVMQLAGSLMDYIIEAMSGVVYENQTICVNLRSCAWSIDVPHP